MELLLEVLEPMPIVLPSAVLRGLRFWLEFRKGLLIGDHPGRGDGAESQQ
jgi:hypothetical protein